MKKVLFFAALAIVFAGCTSNDADKISYLGKGVVIDVKGLTNAQVSAEVFGHGAVNARLLSLADLGAEKPFSIGDTLMVYGKIDDKGAVAGVFVSSTPVAGDVFKKMTKTTPIWVVFVIVFGGFLAGLIFGLIANNN